MTYNSISISKDRVAVELTDNRTAQFVCFDLEESKHNDLTNQFHTAFAICSTFDEIVAHLNINGYEASLEDVFFSQIEN